MSEASPARTVALRVVERVLREGAYADIAFRAEAERLDERDRAFAQALAYGTIQRVTTLDWAIGKLASRPRERIDASVLDALRLGVQQVAFMGGVPAHASVDSTVSLVRAAAPAATGFANAVMRRAAREAPGLIAALGDDTPAEAAVKHSHPEWIARLWWDELGPEVARALLARDNEPPESAVRVNLLRASREEVAAALPVRSRPAPELPEGLVLEEPFDVHGSELFAAGGLTPQSRASMLVGRVVAPRPGERLADVCAAPGTKTTHLVELAGGDGQVVAVDHDPRRARALEGNLQRIGAAAEVVVADARSGLPGAPFDRVLLDPPCSALGTLQARPDVRWRRSAADLDALVELQASLLAAAAAGVRAGGTLIYSLCTISAREGQQQMERFLSSNRDFEAVDLGAERPALACAGDPRFLQHLPHRDLTDGFFIAALRRSSP